MLRYALLLCQAKCHACLHGVAACKSWWVRPGEPRVLGHAWLESTYTRTHNEVTHECMCFCCRR